MNGTFYHEDGKQIIKDAEITGCVVNGVTILSGVEVPTTLSAPAGSLYFLLLAGSVGLYQNTGSSLIPVWRKLEASV